ncbi:15757_t:CDS:2, partial [Gigaspora rosea]
QIRPLSLEKLALAKYWNVTESEVPKLLELNNSDEGVVIDNNGPELRYSAGFSTLDVETLRQYIITSTRCLSNSQNFTEIYYAPWHPTFHEQQGILKLNLMIRSSYEEYPLLFINDFDFGESIQVGHHTCKTGYDTLTTCGEIKMLFMSRRLLIKTKWCIRCFSSS